MVNVEEALDEYHLKIQNDFPKDKKFDGIILAVSHDMFSGIKIEFWDSLLKDKGLIYDLKGTLGEEIDCIRL